MKQVIALLDTMWDPQYAGRKAPALFSINPNNRSGKRLYEWTQGKSLGVTNSCPIATYHAQVHGVPDPDYVRANLEKFQRTRPGTFEVLLVCGRVAQLTFDRCKWQCGSVRVIKCPHPAARTWTKNKSHQMRELVLHSANSFLVQSRHDSPSLILSFLNAPENLK